MSGFSNYLRREIYEKCWGMCVYCTVDLSDSWHIDHYIPKSKGGSDDPSNLLAACPSCNCRKSDTMPRLKSPEYFLERAVKRFDTKITISAQIGPQIDSMGFTVGQLETIGHMMHANGQFRVCHWIEKYICQCDTARLMDYLRQEQDADFAELRKRYIATGGPTDGSQG